LYEKLKDINEVFRCRKLKDRQYNCQKKQWFTNHNTEN